MWRDLQRRDEPARESPYREVVEVGPVTPERSGVRRNDPQLLGSAAMPLAHGEAHPARQRGIRLRQALGHRRPNPAAVGSVSPVREPEGGDVDEGLPVVDRRHARDHGVVKQGCHASTLGTAPSPNIDLRCRRPVPEDDI